MPAAQVFSGTGNPNGVVDGNPGDVYQDQTGKFWLNVAAPSTWVQLATAGAFALLNFDWQAGAILSQQNITAVTRPVAPDATPYNGIRDFTLSTPIPDLDRVVFSGIVESFVVPPLIPEPPALPGPPTVVNHPLNWWAMALDASTIRIVVYDTTTVDGVPTSAASLSEDAVRVTMRVDLVP